MAKTQRRSTAPRAKQERLSVVDTAWLRLETPVNPTMIVSVLTTATPVRAVQLRRRLARSLERFPTLRRRPVTDALGAAWHDDAFSLDEHWVDTVLPAPAGPRELQALVGRLASEPLNPSQPLWQIHFVARYGHGSAWVLRVHHCYADGMALLHVLASLTDPAPQPHGRRAGLGGRPVTSRGAGKDAASITSWLEQLLMPPTSADARPWAELGAHLASLPDETLRFAGEVGGLVEELARLLTLPDDPVTPLQGALSGDKRVAWSAPLDFAEIRACSHALGCTVNDLLLATLAGALGAYLREVRGTATAGLVLRAAVPVNLRAGETAAMLGNRFGLLFVDLPVGVVDPLARVERMHETMQVLKGTRQPVMTLAALGLSGLLPTLVQRPAVEFVTRKGTLVASNVPGPRTPLYLCGQRIETLHFWVPAAGTIGLGISLLSYAGTLSFGVIADRALLPDPDVLVHHFRDQLEQTLRVAAMRALRASRVGTPRRGSRAPAAAASSPRRRRKRATAARSPSQD